MGYFKEKEEVKCEGRVEGLAGIQEDLGEEWVMNLIKMHHMHV